MFAKTWESNWMAEGGGVMKKITVKGGGPKINGGKLRKGAWRGSIMYNSQLQTAYSAPTQKLK